MYPQWNHHMTCENRYYVTYNLINGSCKQPTREWLCFARRGGWIVLEASSLDKTQKYTDGVDIMWERIYL